MGNRVTDGFCCRDKNNIDKDFIDKNIDDNKYYSVNLKKLLKIQALGRKFIVRKNLVKSYFSEKLIPGNKAERDYIPKFEIIDTNFSVFIENLKNYEIDEEEFLREKNSKGLKEYSIIYPDDSFYKGYFNKFWKREGKGTLFTEGNKYEGQFKNNDFNGKGRLISIEGFYYEGEFKDNKANGFGKYFNSDGTKYKGFWKDDLQSGKGEETFSDGSKYAGNFLDGKKNGLGKFIWPGSSYYDGNFEDNEISGYGIYYWKDGRVFLGDWVKNKMEGSGVFFWPDGKKYIGSYSNDKKDGYGLFIWPDGRSYEGEWKNGKQNGYGIFKSRNDTRCGEWVSGEKISWIDKKIENYENIIDHLKLLKLEYNFEKIYDKYEYEKDRYKKDLHIFKLINNESVNDTNFKLDESISYFSTSYDKKGNLEIEK